MAQTYRDQIIISWDNFDYNQNVQHQTLREPAKHISATTGKLCIGHYIPDGGLYRSMLRPEIALDPCDITLATGNQDDEILHACQRYWIAEAIRYTHRTAVEKLFSDSNPITTGKMRQRSSSRAGQSFQQLSIFLRARHLTMALALSWRMRVRLVVHTVLSTQYLQSN